MLTFGLLGIEQEAQPIVVEKRTLAPSKKGSLGLEEHKLFLFARAEEFGQNYVRSAATSVDKSENSPQFSYIILRWMRWI